MAVTSTPEKVEEARRRAEKSLRESWDVPDRQDRRAYVCVVEFECDRQGVRAVIDFMRMVPGLEIRFKRWGKL